MKKWERKYSIILLLLMPLFIFLLNKNDERIEQKETKEYPSFIKIKSEISGIIVSRRMSKVWKNYHLFELSDKTKFGLSGFNTLEQGDSIFKPSNSDSLIIISNKRESMRRFKLNP